MKCLLLLELNVNNRMLLERPFKLLEQIVGECVYIVSFGKYFIFAHQDVRSKTIILG